MSDEIKYPAIMVGQWAAGPVNLCVKHASQLKAVGDAMGAPVNFTPLLSPAECSNCVNENKGKA